MAPGGTSLEPQPQLERYRARGRRMLYKSMSATSNRLCWVESEPFLSLVVPPVLRADET